MSTPRWAKCGAWFSTIVALSLVLLVSPSASADAVLEVAIGGETRYLARDTLLSAPDVTSIEIAHDVAYGKAMRFRAIPLAVLLGGFNAPADGVIETVALDGFAAHLPLALVSNTDPAKAMACSPSSPQTRGGQHFLARQQALALSILCGLARWRRRSAANNGHIKW